MICGIIAEYNPFHNGHAYHIGQIRTNDSDGIICVMSNNWVQRGEPAVAEGHLRAEIAVKNGVDLVIALPARYSIASAEDFAYGGVYLLNALGIVDSLSFGSENGSVEYLNDIYNKINIIEDRKLIKKYMTLGITFPKARQMALNEIGFNEDFNKPNNILGVEYIKALNKLNSPIKPRTFKRIGDYHDIYGQNEYMSASAIRELIYKRHDFNGPMPENAYKMLQNNSVIDDLLIFERLLLAFFRTCKPIDLSDIYAIREGLEHRLIKASQTAKSLEEFYMIAKSKRYTLSTIRRAALCAFLGIKKTLEEPKYIHVLAFNDKGRQFLSQIKKTSILPVIHSYSHNNSSEIQKIMDEERKYTDIYALLGKNIENSYKDFTISSIYV